MQTIRASQLPSDPVTAIIYGAPGAGKTTMLGMLPGKTLVLDIDRTTGVLRNSANAENIEVCHVDNIKAWDNWGKLVAELSKDAKGVYDNIAIDNVSELERCILSALGSEGKNNGVPSQGDYQYMQFRLVNSLRHLKETGANLIWTAWETTKEFAPPGGQVFHQYIPQINHKILNNMCGLCNIVGRLCFGKEDARGIVLQASNTIYAKNQYDSRAFCLQDSLMSKEETPDAASSVSTEAG